MEILSDFFYNKTSFLRKKQSLLSTQFTFGKDDKEDDDLNEVFEKTVIKQRNYDNYIDYFTETPKKTYTNLNLNKNMEIMECFEYFKFIIMEGRKIEKMKQFLVANVYFNTIDVFDLILKENDRDYLKMYDFENFFEENINFKNLFDRFGNPNQKNLMK